MSKRKPCLTAEDEREISIRTVAILTALGVPTKIIVADDDNREIVARGARVDAGDDHCLTFLELPASGDQGKRIDCYLAPDSDFAGEAQKLRAPMRLYTIAERPPPVYI